VKKRLGHLLIDEAHDQGTPEEHPAVGPFLGRLRFLLAPRGVGRKRRATPSEGEWRTASDQEAVGPSAYLLGGKLNEAEALGFASLGSMLVPDELFSHNLAILLKQLDYVVPWGGGELKSESPDLACWHEEGTRWQSGRGCLRRACAP
jgi:hypothetical protein